jgi:hypothetical protein
MCDKDWTLCAFCVKSIKNNSLCYKKHADWIMKVCPEDYKQDEIIEQKDIVWWIHRILDEKTKELKLLSEEISILNHQAQNFNVMCDSVKNEVIYDLNKSFKKYKWFKKISEV